MALEAHQRRCFWQDTLVTDKATVVVEYSYGMLVPTIYIRGGGRVYPESVSASLFCGPDAKDEREWEMGLISQALGASSQAASGARAVDSAFEKATPTLYAFMTLLEEEGKPRSPSSIVLFTEDGCWKVCLTEKDAGLQLWRTGETFQKALQALEKALVSGQADWRKKWVPGSSGKGSKGKK